MADVGHRLDHFQKKIPPIHSTSMDEHFAWLKHPAIRRVKMARTYIVVLAYALPIFLFVIGALAYWLA